MKLFIDMDGTLAEWKSTASPEELLEKGYFYNLRPLSSVKMVKMLAGVFDTYILSAVIPDSAYAKLDKLAWLEKYLPEIPKDHILFSVDGLSKREYAKNLFGEVTRYDVLLDDYSKNLDDWGKSGTPVKFLNGINAKSGRNYPYAISDATAAQGCVGNILYMYELLKRLKEEEKEEKNAIMQRIILEGLREMAV